MPARPLPDAPDAIDPAWVADLLVGAGSLPAPIPLAVAVERIAADRGFTGVIARVHWRGVAGAPSGRLVVKFPETGTAFERAAREVRFYTDLAPACPVRLPPVLLAAADAGADRVVLVMEDVDARPGDVLAGWTFDEARAAIAALARLHARWWGDATLSRRAWLPAWGAGQAGTDRPHRRRAERYRRRLGPFLERFGADAVDGLAPRLGALADRFEALLGTVAALPPTLIHADVHLDNLLFDADGVIVLDWQSVSAGPALYDVARLLTETPPDGDPAAVAALLDAYRADLAAAGVTLDADRIRADFRCMLDRVMAGFVSGYGGRDPARMTGRERAMIRRALSREGLAGTYLGASDGPTLTA